MMKFFLVFLLIFAVTSTSLAQTEPAQDAPQPGDTRMDAFGMAQVYVPAGCFMMGITADEAAALIAQNPPDWVQQAIPREEPQHEVCLSSGYWMDEYEVTNAAFQAFVDAGGYTDETYWSAGGFRLIRALHLPKPCEGDDASLMADDHPRVCVNWYEAQAYARWRGGSLPTEAQWEYAARGPETLTYPWGNAWNPANANVVDNQGTTAVGSYPEGASWVGAQDMAGNAMEWVSDWLSPNYEQAGHDDPTGPARGGIKVERGGWWGSNEFVARTTYRHYEDPPTYQDHHIGFRIVSPANDEAAPGVTETPSGG
jgi:formylglycine-generating enzyme required for sulfatase activity